MAILIFRIPPAGCSRNFVCLQISQFGSRKCVDRFFVFAFLLEGTSLGLGVSTGCSRSLLDDFVLPFTKRSVNSYNQSGMRRSRSHDAVCRTRSPEAELRLVSGEASADSEMSSSLVTLGATIGTNLSGLQGLMLPFFKQVGDRCFNIHTETTNVLRKVFRKITRLGIPWRVGQCRTCPNLSRRRSFALSYVSSHHPE